jgi:hypothetical protein
MRMDVASAIPQAHAESVLFLTIDSCRFDSFEAAQAPNLKACAPLHRAKAPSHFTYGSHAAMFVGFTPGLPGAALPFLDSKFGKLFKLDAPGFADPAAAPGFALSGASVMDGFRRRGYRTFGSGGVSWFDPSTPTGRRLTEDFEAFFYPGGSWHLRDQLGWLEAEMQATDSAPEFVFLNIGETHAPYYFEGAPWDSGDNPCRPFQQVDRAEECRHRQRAALEFADGLLGPLLRRFAGATILICGDHGDCWGEDGLWEHGVSHEMTLTVPLLIRLRGSPVGQAGP